MTPARPRIASAKGTTGGLMEKGLALLQLVAERGEVTAGDVAQGIGLTRSTSYRLIDRLRTAGYLQESRVPGSLRLGPQVVPLGVAALNQLDLMEIAPARLTELAQAAGETVNLAIPRGEEMIYIYQAEGPGAVKVAAHLGTRRPITCSSLGRAYLAALPDEDGDRLLSTLPLVRLTRRSIGDPGALRAEITATRARGYSLDVEEVEDGVSCIGAAIRDYNRRPIAAISIAGPAERMPDKRDALVALLCTAAADISKRTGYQG